MGKNRNTNTPNLRHVRLYHWLMKTQAWQSLGVVARALYIELSSHYHGTNNGEIIFSVRQAATALGISKDTAARAFEVLQKRGFIAVQRKGGFNLKLHKGQATEWRLTEFPYGTNGMGTKEFTRWSPGNDSPVERGPKPSNNRKSSRGSAPAGERSITLANYTCPTTRTVEGKIQPLESHRKDQNVVSAQHQSHNEDRSVPIEGLEVSPEGPRSKNKRSGVTS